MKRNGYDRIRQFLDFEIFYITAISLFIMRFWQTFLFFIFILMRSGPTGCQGCISGKGRPVRTHRYFRCGLHDIAEVVNRQFLTEIPIFF